MGLPLRLSPWNKKENNILGYTEGEVRVGRRFLTDGRLRLPSFWSRAFWRGWSTSCCRLLIGLTARLKLNSLTESDIHMWSCSFYCPWFFLPRIWCGITLGGLVDEVTKKNGVLGHLLLACYRPEGFGGLMSLLPPRNMKELWTAIKLSIAIIIPYSYIYVKGV